jgi:hypothetical protein
MLMGDLELRYEHLGKHRDTPARRQRRQRLKAHIDQIWAEQELYIEAMRPDRSSEIPPLEVADRYAGGKSGSTKSH